MKICPYYGTRKSINSAEIVALPYNILFQKETRQSFSINLKNQIIIIDEAHNLIDTISQIHTVEINDLIVTQSLTQLNNYINRYKNKFSAKNMLYLKHLLVILNGLNKLLTAKTEAKNESKIWTINEFLVITKFFNLNFIKILRFCEETQLEKKVFY
jgi:chromosome transmission fidelity protein 1